MGVNNRTVAQVEKRFKDMKHAVLDKKRRAAGTGGGGPLPDLPFEDLVSAIIGDTTNLVNGVEGKCTIQNICPQVAPTNPTTYLT